MVFSPLTHSYLGRQLQTVLQVFARWIISKEGKPRQLRLPHANPLVQCIEELFHCGGSVETHHLPEKIKVFSGYRSCSSHSNVANFEQENFQGVQIRNDRCTVCCSFKREFKNPLYGIAGHQCVNTTVQETQTDTHLV